MRIEQLWPRHPPRCGQRAGGLTPRRLHPLPIVGEQCGQIVFVPIGEKHRDTAWRQHLHDLMDEALRHRERAIPDVDRQQQFAFGVYGRPYRRENSG